MNKNTKIYLDTSIQKAGIYAETRIVPGRGILDIPTHTKLIGKDIHEEIKLLPEIINVAKTKMIKFCTNFETTLELLGTITIGRKKNYFHNVTIEKVQAPIEYSRVLGTIEISAKSIQKKFLEGINDKRFIELQKATGAYQGENETNRNQLLDAFHIWCAEYNGCEYFLTLDFKLLNHLKQVKAFKSKVKIYRPSELLEEVKHLTNQSS